MVRKRHRTSRRATTPEGTSYDAERMGTSKKSNMDLQVSVTTTEFLVTSCPQGRPFSGSARRRHGLPEVKRSSSRRIFGPRPGTPEAPGRASPRASTPRVSPGVDKIRAKNHLHSAPRPMTYEYICQACGHQWEAQQSIKADPLKDCPNCHKAEAKRQISRSPGFILKGGGWYSDLYSSSSTSSSGSSGGSDSGSSGSSGSGSKSD